MKTKIEHNIIPEMPPAIIDAIQDNRLVLFVGAGISSLLGLPLWNKLSNDLVSLCREQNLLSRSEEEVLLNSSYTSVQKVSIAVYLLDENAEVSGKDGKDWIKTMLEFCPDEQLKEKADLLGYFLSKYKSPILTTNADVILERTQSLKARKINNSLEECPKGYLNPDSLTHIHGSILKKETLVFTSQDYAQKYLSTSEFGKLLKKALESKTILFIGYGVNEFELIRYFLDSAKDNKDFSLFKLDGYFDKDSYRIDLDSRYLEKLKIKLLDYSLENNGYDALIDVLKEWDKKIDKELNPESKLLDEVSGLLTEAPRKGKVERICQLLKQKKIDIRYFCAEFCNSKYFIKWLQRLIGNKELFKASLNFEYPIAVGENRYRSGDWVALNILSHYAKLRCLNPTIDNEIISIIKECSRLIKIDLNQKEVLKRRSASFSIMHELVSIIISKPSFFNVKESFEIIKTYLFFEKSSPSMFVDELFTNQAIINEGNKDYLSEIIKSLILSMDEDYLFDRMKGQSFEKIISTNPTLYFSFGIHEFFKKKELFYTMGSFYGFQYEEFAEPKERFLIYLINTAVKYIPLNELKESISKNMLSKTETKNKMAVCILGIRLTECTDLFKKFKKKIFNTQHLYSDLASLIQRNLGLFINDNDFYKELKELCEVSTFGFENTEKIKVLRTNLLNILSNADSELQFLPLDIAELNFIKNVNKHVYSLPYDSKSETDAIFNKIKGLSVKDAFQFVQHELTSSSRYFETRLFEALDLYLKNKDFIDYKNCLKIISYKYLIHFLYKLNEHEYASSENDLLVISDVLDIVSEPDYEKIFASVLYALEKAYSGENGINIDYENVLSKIKYQSIVLEEKTITGDAMNTIINTNLHSYLVLIVNYSFKKEEFKLLVDEAFEYFRKKYGDNIVFKAIIAYFYPFLCYFNRQKYSHLFLDIFGTNQSSACYEALAYSRNVNKELLKQLTELPQFNYYLFKHSEDRMHVKRNYAAYLIYEYISNDSFKNLVEKLVGDIRFMSSVEDVVRWGSEDLKNNKKNTSSYKKLFLLCNNNYSSNLVSSYDVDQLIRFVSEYINLLNGNCDEGWTLLVLLTKYMKSYFSDEYMNLISTFKNDYSNYVIELVDNFVNIYEQHKFSETVVIELFNILSPAESYHELLVKWKTKLLRKNPFLNKKI